MEPIPIPFAMEYVSGIMISAKNAGTAEHMSLISTFAKLFIINTPTKINAGAVAALGITVANGLKNRQNAKQIAVTTLARPVLAPAATPEADSTKVVQVDVPSIAPVTVEMESASIDLFTLIGSPFSSNILA